MDEDDFSPSMFLLDRMLSMGMMVLVPILVLSVVAPVVLYLIARSRANRDPVADPQLGLKFALTYFQTTSYQLMLAGAFVLLFAMLSKLPSEAKEYIYRPAFGVIVPAGIIFGVHTWALTRTNHREHPLISRLFAGYSLIVTGMVGTAAMVAVFVILFQKGETGDAGRIAWSMFLVYTTAWVVQAIAFVRRTAAFAPHFPPPPPPPPPGPGSPPPEEKPPVPAPMAKPLA